jgi:hypothetical protein
VPKERRTILACETMPAHIERSFPGRIDPSNVIVIPTRQLFVGFISLMATFFAMLGGLLAIMGKL